MIAFFTFTAKSAAAAEQYITDVTTAAGEDESGDESAEGTGTVISSSTGRIPRTTEMIILITLIILIPVATIVIKKRLDKKVSK